MARLIPNEPAGNVSPPVARMFRLIKSLPDDFTAWLALAGQDDTATRPHFFLVWQERYCFLIHVAETSQQLAETALQADFLTKAHETISADTLGHDETEILDEFAGKVHNELGLPSRSHVAVRRLVVFPDVKRRTIDEIILQRSKTTQTRYLGCHQIGERQFADYLIKLAEDALPPYSLAVFRKHFNPESRIPSAFSPLQSPERKVRAELTEMLFDFDQEAVAKADLMLPKDGEALVRDLGARLVTGVAGSGKSLILIVRALLIARLNKASRLLVLTHNRPLAGELKQRFRKLTGHWPSFQWLTYFQWVKQCLPDQEWPEKILSGRALETLARQILVEHNNLAGFTVPFLVDEITWIKDQRVLTRDAYLTAKRQGREVSLTSPQRSSIWAFFREFQLALERQQATDWSGVAMRLWNAVRRDNHLTLPTYDAILVDEAQFFAPAWFDCIKAALKPGGQLFLCADPTQGFLRRRQSWLASGIDVRGRTVRLEQSYRNSQAILAFATRFYQQRLGDDADDETLNLPSRQAIAAAPVVGAQPAIVQASSVQDLHSRLINEIIALHRHDLRPGSILILHQSFQALAPLRERLDLKLGDGAAMVLQETFAAAGQEPLVRLSTLNAATGLESPIVFIVGLDEVFEKERDPQLTPEQHAALVRDNTRQAYMAITRAARQLVILCRHSRTRAILEAAMPTHP